MLKDMLRIWSWDEENLTLEKGHEWNTANRTGVLGVYPSDVDGDGDTELITVGFDSNGTVSYAQLRIWCWNGDTLVLEKSQEWYNVNLTEVKSLSIEDVDGDGKQEILTSGLGTAPIV